MSSLSAEDKEKLLTYLQQIDGSSVNPGPQITEPPMITLIEISPEEITGISGEIHFAAVDPDGGPLSYTWSATVPSPVAFSSTSVAEPSLTFTAIGTYSFSVIVTDDEGDSVTSSIQVQVIPTPTEIRIK